MGYKLWQRYGFTFIRPLVIGGICYTVGAIIEYQHKLVIINGILCPHEILVIIQTPLTKGSPGTENPARL